MFSRGSRAPAQGRAKGATFSFIGAEVSVTGDIAAAGQLHIDGKVCGDVHCRTLTQGETGAVQGNIEAEEACLAGLVDGTVEAGTLTLEPTARVTGDILYETLTVATGAQIEGRFKRRKGAEDGSRGAKLAAAVAAPEAAPPKPQPPELFAPEPAVEAAE